MRRIFITGCNGQLGRALNMFYRDNPSVELFNTDVDNLDITNESAVMSEVQKVRPNIIINCAAYTKVDACEENEQEAYKINAIGIRNLCRAANAVNAVIVHISTDYVFDGEKKLPYLEDDDYAPQSAYGRTKMEGEKFVLQLAERFFILRTAWLYGDGKNFVNTMLELSDKHDSVRVVDDQFGTPTSAKELVKVIDLLCASNKYGIYHATCEGSCSWSEFTEVIFQMCGKDTRVIPVSTKEYGAKAKRPAYSVLENRKLSEEFGYHMQNWKTALQLYLTEQGLIKKELIHSMGKKKVLVTGANGYIGRHVVAALLDMGHEVIASDFSYDGVDGRAIKTEVSLFSGAKDIYEQFGKPDVCVHMAWRNGFVHNAESHLMDLPDHYMFIKNMIEGGLPQIAIMGTMHEIGYWEGAIKEDTPTNPTSLYGISKNALRQMTFLLANEKNVKVDWLRAYYILGDDEKSNSLFGKIVGWEKEGKETFPFNSGRNKYDFISVEQLSKQIASVATQDMIHGIINCCTGNPVSLADKVQEFISEHGFKIRPEFGAFPDRPYDSPGVWGDAEKIKKIMNSIK